MEDAKIYKAYIECIKKIMRRLSDRGIYTLHEELTSEIALYSHLVGAINEKNKTEVSNA